MAYGQTSSANVLQTAFNVSATIVAAQIQAGILADQEAVDEALDNYKTVVFNELKAELGNTPAPAPSPERRVKSGSNGSANPGEVKFTFGKFNGKTIAEVHKEDTSYLTWLTQKDTKEVRNFIRDKAQAYLDSIRA